MTFRIYAAVSARLGGPLTAGPRFPERRWRIGGSLALRAVVIAVGLTASRMPASAGPLPPLPAPVVFTNAFASDDRGGTSSGGTGISEAEANGVYQGNTNSADASASTDTLSPPAPGKVSIGTVIAAANTIGTSHNQVEASAFATLNFWFRVTPSNPLSPANLFGLPLTVSIDFAHWAYKAAVAKAWVFPGELSSPSDIDLVVDDVGIMPKQHPGVNLTHTSLAFDASPYGIYQIELLVAAIPDYVTNFPNPLPSAAVIDPAIGFDQQRFDQEAAQLGVQSVPLDQFFQFDFSPGLDLLPRTPSDLVEELGFNSSPGTGAGGAVVPEPSSLALLLAGLGMFGVTHVVRRSNAISSVQGQYFRERGPVS